MAKKVLALLVSATMVMGLMAGCGSSAAAPAADAAEEAVEEAAEDVEEAAEETAEDVGEAAEDAAEDVKEAVEDATAGDADYSALKIGMIFNVTKDDGGWCQAQWTGLVDAAERLGLKENENYWGIELVDEEPVATTSAIEELIETNGCNVIIGASTGYAPILEELATQYPDVQFCQVGVPLNNVLTYHGRGYQGMYALGYMMAKLDGTDNMGYVAGMSEASVRFSINGFALGAKAYNPNVKINLQWANSWWDQTAEAECANVLIASNVKYMGTGTTSPGAAQACSEKGAFCTGYDVDHSDFAPDAVTASLVWDWSPIFEEIFKNFVEGGMVPYVDNYFWGVEHDCVKIAFNENILDADTIAETQGILDQIASGDIDVFGGELLSNDGTVLVEEGQTMADDVILDQEFLVDNVVGSWF